MSQGIELFVGLRQGGYTHNVLRLPPAVVELSFIGPRASGALVKPRNLSSVVKIVSVKLLSEKEGQVGTHRITSMSSDNGSFTQLVSAVTILLLSLNPVDRQALSPNERLCDFRYFSNAAASYASSASNGIISRGS